MHEWSFLYPEVPQQDNIIDCGLYCMYFIKCIAKRRPIIPFDPLNMRSRVLWAILANSPDEDKNISSIINPHQEITYISPLDIYLNELEVSNALMDNKKLLLTGKIQLNCREKPYPDKLWYESTQTRRGNTFLFEEYNPFADGNCLLRCISWQIWGTEEKWLILRIITIRELLRNEWWYKGRPTDGDFNFEKDWHEILNDAFQLSGYLTIPHLFALSNALKRVFVLYKPDGTVQQFTGSFFPFRRECNLEESSNVIPLAWSSTYYDVRRLNHFVCLRLKDETQSMPFSRALYSKGESIHLYSSIAKGFDFQHEEENDLMQKRKVE